MRAPIVAAAIAAALATSPAMSRAEASPAPVVLTEVTAPIARWFQADATTVLGARWARSTISIPSSIAWTAPGETDSAWIMLSVGTGGMRVGWRWAEGSAPALFVDSWAGSGSGYVADPVDQSSPDAQLPTPSPGSTISVGVSLLSVGSTANSHDYAAFAMTPGDGDRWPLAAPLVAAPFTPADTSLAMDSVVTRAVEAVTPAGDAPPTTSQPVAFTDALLTGATGGSATLPPASLTAETLASEVSPAVASEIATASAAVVLASPWQTTGTTVMTHSFGASHFGDNNPTQPPLTWEQATISVPSAMRWTATSGQASSAWIMANASPVQWDQIGWAWHQGATAPQLFAETGQSPAYQSLNDPIQYGPKLTPGSSITVAVGCNPGTETFTNWVQIADVWRLWSQVNANQPCGEPGLTWTRALEDVSAVGQPQPTPAQPVHFTAASAESAAGAPISLPPFTAVKGTYSINE